MDIFGNPFSSSAYYLSMKINKKQLFMLEFPPGTLDIPLWPNTVCMPLDDNKRIILPSTSSGVVANITNVLPYFNEDVVVGDVLIHVDTQCTGSYLKTKTGYEMIFEISKKSLIPYSVNVTKLHSSLVMSKLQGTN